jgi:hypothetical protein
VSLRAGEWVPAEELSPHADADGMVRVTEVRAAVPAVAPETPA